MAEPEAAPDGSHDDQEQTQITRLPPVAPEPAAPAVGDLLLFNGVEPTDDTPTIISRSAQSPIRPEDAIAGVLRGRHLAHFELLDPIGVGGMAAVIRAHDMQLDRTVALKILPPDMAHDAEIVRRFQQEARAAAKLDHENIARVFFCGEDQGLHFIAFEFVEGENLKALLERRGRIPVPEAIGYMLQIATGLAHASARGVVHRDIKPSNIIISSNGRAKLVDMGLARSLEPHADGGLTQSGVTLGTFDYISPEQALEPRDADVRSDIYSLGCTFYHMLTGQPPVPEGTAARKLHHHQHIAPLDPRQIDPEIPDDVAALLGRMMAKEPGSRYQRPEHLVQHLILLAQKLGAVADVPESVLFVDAPLPGPPRKRPLLMAAVAVVAVVVLVFALGQPSDPPPQRITANAGESPSSEGNAKGLDQAASGKVAIVPPAADVDKAREEASTLEFEPKRYKEQELADYLARNKNAKIRVKLSDDLVLKRDSQLVVSGGDVTFEPANPNATRMPVLLVEYDSRDTTPSDPLVGLRVLAGSVHLKGIRLELDPHNAKIVMSGVEVQGGQVVLERCQLVARQCSGPSRISTVSMSSRSGVDGEPALVLKRCYFEAGQQAVYLSGPALVQATACALGPHNQTLFHLARENADDLDRRRSVEIRGCSAFLKEGSAFRIDQEVEARLHVENCVFSRPEAAVIGPALGALIEKVGEPEGSFRYTGAGNYYHNLAAFWVRPMAMGDPDVIPHLDGFRQRFGIQDEDSVERDRNASPWNEKDPLQLLEDGQPRRAFTLRTDVPELRQVIKNSRVNDAERCAWQPIYDQNLPPLERKPSEAVVRAKDKIFDPNAERRGNVYRKLSEAIDDAQPGDTILIRRNGPLAIDPVELKKADAELTIKPYEGYRPVLKIGQSTDPDTALFRVHDGKLALENLEFVLSPDRAGYKALSVVMVMGDGQCVVKDCVATLRDDYGTPLSFVTLSDPSMVMKMGQGNGQQQVAGMSISGSFVRGTGQFLTVRVSRPFELKVEDSLIVLTGSFLQMDGNAKDAMARGTADITLNHVTTYLTDQLFLLKALKDSAMNLKGLVNTRVLSAADCIFASATGKPLIHLDGVDSEEQMKRYFAWQESRHNAFSNVSTYLDQVPAATNEMAPPAYNQDAWKVFTNDVNSLFAGMRFQNAPGPDAPMWKVLPADFRTRANSNLAGCGANIERLRRPSDENDAAGRASASPDD